MRESLLVAHVKSPAPPQRLLRTVGETAGWPPRTIDCVIDLTGHGRAHWDDCRIRWPGAAIHALATDGMPSWVTPITGPPLCATSSWGAALLPQHGVLGEIAQRPESKSASVLRRRSSRTTLDDYLASDAAGYAMILLLPCSFDAVETVLGASRLLERGRIAAVGVFEHGDEVPSTPALDMIAGILGKFDFRWVGVDLERRAFAVQQGAGFESVPGAGIPTKETWVATASRCAIAIRGVIAIGKYVAADLTACRSIAACPVFLVDADFFALARHRHEVGGAGDLTCIGAAVSDGERMVSLHVGEDGQGTYFSTPDAYFAEHGKAAFERFIEVTTCTLDSLAAKYPWTAANVLTVDLNGNELAALKGAVGVLKHIDVVDVALRAPPSLPDPADADAVADYLNLQGFFPASLGPVVVGSGKHAVYVRKERRWAVDPMAVMQHVLKAANVSPRHIVCTSVEAHSALCKSTSAADQPAIEMLDGQTSLLAEADVWVLSDDGAPAFREWLVKSLSAGRLSAILLLGSLPEHAVEQTMRLGFDHGFLMDRASASASARLFVRSSVIRHPSEWLRKNNQFGRREFKFSALGKLGRFGNQIFQITHLILSALRHNATASMCAWMFNEYFRLSFLEAPGRGTKLEVSSGMWQIMGIWGLDDPPPDIDFHGHLQWLAPFLSRHRAFVHGCFEFQTDWAVRAGRIVDALREEGRPLAAFHVRRTDYLTDAIENPWHQQIPVNWYRRALEGKTGATLFVGSDDLAYVQETFGDFGLMTYQRFEDSGLPPLLIDHCVMRAADTLLMVNSSFSRTAGLLATESQAVLLPSFKTGAFAAYDPWHDPVFWFHFDDRYFADYPRHLAAVEQWLTAAGVPQLSMHERP